MSNRVLPPTVLLSILFGATALSAQDRPCADAAWLGGSEDASDIATRDTPAEQMALVLNANTFVGQFSVSTPQDIRVEAAGRGNGDPTLTLLAADGTEVATDDDSGGNSSARIETTLQPGLYCAVVKSFDDTPMTAFVRVGRQEMEPLTPGMDAAPPTPDTADVAQSCAEGRDLGTLGDAPLQFTASAQDAPFARFTLDAPRQITVTADNAEADPKLVVTGPDGSVVGENDDFDGLNARVDVSTDLSAGTYCIGLDAVSDPSLPIDVAVSAFDPVAALAALYARGEAAPPLDGSVPVTDLGNLPPQMVKDLRVGSDTQWFSLTLDTPGLLLVEAIAAGADGDPWLALFDSLGRQIAQNDDAGHGTDARVTARTQAGTYLIGLRQVGERTGFVRLLTERYVKAP
ncbi:ABC transporter substrate-binding protein [Loktanella sp. M215]|uniref:ABC transporter substrate-binding protein n=1 Tax=Loktanella sp. M215 TaxID=2675431 RepID=UPI001F31A467|nr:ABC transporter substrate-binding protein [Loktanella sp. M215]MCF7699102.1 ABC transporter substrate-binding protein [Loktanella sp. M215]